MKKLKNLLILPFLALSTIIFAQDDYPMKPGEVITIDNEGKIVNSNKKSRSLSKYYPGRDTSSNSSAKVSDYNDDGSPRLPGYSPTGNQETDGQNYKKAKYLFYQHHPSEFKQWQKNYNSLPRPMAVLNKIACPRNHNIQKIVFLVNLLNSFSSQ